MFIIADYLKQKILRDKSPPRTCFRSCSQFSKPHAALVEARWTCRIWLPGSNCFALSSACVQIPGHCIWRTIRMSCHATSINHVRYILQQKPLQMNAAGSIATPSHKWWIRLKKVGCKGFLIPHVPSSVMFGCASAWLGCTCGYPKPGAPPPPGLKYHSKAEGSICQNNCIG